MSTVSKRSKQPRVFFNASVILAGLKSPDGGSGKLLEWAQSGKIAGTVSEIILQEATRRAGKIGWRKEDVEQSIREVFGTIHPAPSKEDVETFSGVISDPGDAHVLASCKETECTFLVSLDKKHILVLVPTIKQFSILSPKQLIETLRK